MVKKMTLLAAAGALMMMTSAANAGFECNGQVGYEAGKRCEDEAGFATAVGGKRLERDRTDPEHNDTERSRDRTESRGETDSGTSASDNF